MTKVEMLEKILHYIKKLIPKPLFQFFQPAYHFILSATGNIIYRFPGYKLTVIGVTGTDGKSTTVDIIASMLRESGEKVGMISTVSIEIDDIKWENKTNRTTLGRWKTHRLMRNMVKLGCKYAVIEVASEGIAWHRIFGIPFDAAVFTNLAPEHLNFHGTMENYRNTKGRLFTKLSNPFNFKKTKRVSVVNADDKEANYFLSFKAGKKYTYGIKKGDIKAENIVAEADKTSYEIVTKKAKYSVKTGAIGKFNVFNELAAFCIGLGYGIEPEVMIKSFEKFKGTIGRVEKIEEGQNFNVIVDYAVTPDAQREVYGELRKFCEGRLISVFGATGDRDKGKRPEMGKTAAELTDIVILTDDETYKEDSQTIINEVYQGIPRALQKKVTVTLDRFTAIKKSLAIAKKGDTVIITGIGHQKYRNMGGTRKAWDERAIVSDLLKNQKGEENKNED